MLPEQRLPHWLLVDAYCAHRSAGRQEPRTVNVLLKTTGGDCSTAVARQLGGLFAASGLPPKFRWDDGMWELGEQSALPPSLLCAG